MDSDKGLAAGDQEEVVAGEDEEAMEGVEEEDSSDSDSDVAEDDTKEQELRGKVEDLRNQLQQNGMYYDGHVQLIAALRELFELEEARKAREKMNLVYPLSPELWLDWVRDEQKVCTTSDERKFIVELFDRAVKEYTSVQVWVEYVMFMLGGGDMAETRAVGDRALTAVGTHVAEGTLIWQVVLLVEKQIYSGLQKPGAIPTEAEVKEQKKQLQRVQALYRRQARVPLINCSPDGLLEEASEYFEEQEPQMLEDLKKTQKKLEEKLPFEEELLRTEDAEDKVGVYRRYINHMRERDNPAVVQSLYERAVTEHCLHAGLWEEYVRYVMHQFPGLDYVVMPVCERSQRNCPWSATLCELHITALQLFNQEGEDITPKVKGAVEKGLSCGLQAGSEATRMWMAYLIFLRRQIQWEQEHHTELVAFRQATQQAIDLVDTYFGEEGDLESELPRFLARIEAMYAKNMEGARDIWNNTIMKRNSNFNKATFWLEFIGLERSYGSEKHCRKLYRRALERVWESVEVVGSSFLHFEQESGTLETMEEFLRRYEDRMIIVNKKRAEDTAKLEAEGEQEKVRSPSKKQAKREKNKQKDQMKSSNRQENGGFKIPAPVNKPVRAANTAAASTKQQQGKGTAQASRGNTDPSPGCKGQVEPPPGLKKDVNPPPGFKKDVDPPPGFKKDVDPPPGFKKDVEPPPGFKMDVEPPPGFKMDVEPPPGFVKGASSTKRAAEDEEEATRKKLKVEAERGVLTKYDIKDESRMIFLSNLAYDTTEDIITDLFSSCGEIEAVRLVKDFKSRSKGFAYLVFKSTSSVSQCLAMDRTQIKGRPVFVKEYNIENHAHRFKYSTELEREKLFVRGLPFTMTEDDIRKAFEPHGKIKEMRLVTYRNGHSKGICYITYHSADAAEKVRQAMNEAELEGKVISVLISDPSAKKKPPDAPGGQMTLLGGGAGGQKKGGGMRPRSTLSLMPRALMKAPTAPSSATPSPPSDATSDSSSTKMSNEDFRKKFLQQ